MELSELTIVKHSVELVRFLKFIKMVLSIGTQVYSNIWFSLCRDQSSINVIKMWSFAREGLIIEWPLNGQFHDAVTDVLRSRTDVKEMVL